MLNLKASHRVTTAMRNAFENAVRQIAWAARHITDTPVEGQLVEKVGTALAHNAGVMRRPDLTINVSPEEWKRLKQMKAV
jgi:hypothetical protein